MSTLMNKDHVIDRVRPVLALDHAGLPLCREPVRILGALHAVGDLGDETVHAELVTAGFLADMPDRVALVAEQLRHVPGATFTMGTAAERARFFVGEVPDHTVELEPFEISCVQVTNALLGLLDPDRAQLPARMAELPAVDVTWFGAALFALWVGCRLPTEAEWEYACGAGTAGQWCCAESDLPRYAWFSENAQDVPHPVGCKEPNQLGLGDMHGNVWEWCEDDYSADYYAVAPQRDPVNGDRAVPAERTHKVNRGGGFLALSEMCRTRYRMHDPAYYHAMDLGFRLARSVPATTT